MNLFGGILLIFLHTIEVEPSPRLYVISATARDTINNQNAKWFLGTWRNY